jgi:D-alanine-D-alanine ligase
MKSKRVLVLTHPRHRPDRSPQREGTERDVWRALKRLGHLGRVVGVNEDLRALEAEIVEFRPHIVFNLMEEYLSEAVFDFHVVSYLEALEIPYTGCNPRGLIYTRNKFLLGHAANGLGVKTPSAILTGKGFGRLPKELPAFPLFVKLNREHASLGIRESNQVRTKGQLQSVCRRLTRDFGGEILVQKFVGGEDVSASVWGNQKIEVMQPRSLRSVGRGSVSTARMKFSPAYQRRHVIKSVEFKGPEAEKIRELSLLLYRHFDLSGYARIDFRVRKGADPVLIDMNANPNLAEGEDFALSARRLGWNYLDAIENILELGIYYRPNV